MRELIASSPRAQELEKFLINQQACADRALDELAFHKQKARESFAAAYAAKPDQGKRMLDGRVSISIRRSAVGHWDQDAAARAGKELVAENPLLFDTLFAPVKQGFKKLIGMGVRLSPDVMRIEETVVYSFHGGDEMLPHRPIAKDIDDRIQKHGDYGTRILKYIIKYHDFYGTRVDFHKLPAYIREREDCFLHDIETYNHMVDELNRHFEGESYRRSSNSALDSLGSRREKCGIFGQSSPRCSAFPARFQR